MSVTEQLIAEARAEHCPYHWGDVPCLTIQLAAALERAERVIYQIAETAEGHPAMCCGQCIRLVHDAEVRAQRAEKVISAARALRTQFAGICDWCGNRWPCDARDLDEALREYGEVAK